MDERYTKDRKKGEAYQDHVADEFWKQGIAISYFCSVERQRSGESRTGIEVKYDGNFQRTGNLFIEYEERRTEESNWHPSGILKQDNSWAIAIGDYDIIYLFPVKLLRFVRKEFQAVVTPTAKGYLLPLEKAEKFSVFKIENGKLITQIPQPKENNNV